MEKAIILLSIVLFSLAHAKVNVTSRIEYPRDNEARFNCVVHSTSILQTISVHKSQPGTQLVTVAVFHEDRTTILHNVEAHIRYSHAGFKEAAIAPLRSFSYAYAVWIHIKGVTELDKGQYICKAVSNEQESHSSKGIQLKGCSKHHKEGSGVREHEGKSEAEHGRHHHRHHDGKHKKFFDDDNYGKLKMALVAVGSALVILSTILFCCCCCRKTTPTPSKLDRKKWYFEQNLAENSLYPDKGKSDSSEVAISDKTPLPI